MSDYALGFAAGAIALGFIGVILAFIICIEEDVVEKTYSSDSVNKARDFGGDVEPKK